MAIEESDDKPPRIPIRTDVSGGRSYLWCSCGLSRRQPYCDDSHHGSSFEPVRFKSEETLTVALCGCKRTKRPPYCDGTHAYPEHDQTQH
jgi:CDGSH-type Zn-finger protein